MRFTQPLNPIADERRNWKRIDQCRENLELVRTSFQAQPGNIMH